MLFVCAQSETLCAMVAAYTLYSVFWSTMGLQLSSDVGSSPLSMSMVVELFQEGGILAFIWQVFWMVVMID